MMVDTNPSDAVNPLSTRPNAETQEFLLADLVGAENADPIFEGLIDGDEEISTLPGRLRTPPNVGVGVTGGDMDDDWYQAEVVGEEAAEQRAGDRRHQRRHAPQRHRGAGGDAHRSGPAACARRAEADARPGPTGRPRRPVTKWWRRWTASASMARIRRSASCSACRAGRSPSANRSTRRASGRCPSFRT